MTGHAALDRLGLTLAGVSAVSWSLAGVWVRLLPGVPVATIVALRLSLSLLVVAPVVLKSRPRLGHPDGTAWRLAVAMVAYYGLAVASFLFAPVAEATLFINASPLFAVGWALVRRQRVSPMQRTGTFVALAGVAVILLPGFGAAGAIGGPRLVGGLLALGAAALMAFYAISYQHARQHGTAPAPLLVTTLTFTLGTLLLAALAAVQGRAAFAGLGALPAWGPMAGLAVVTTAIPTFAYSVASHRLPPLTTTTVRLLTPVFATLAAWLVLGEVPSWWLLPGGLLTLGGLYLTVRPPSARQADRL